MANKSKITVFSHKSIECSMVLCLIKLKFVNWWYNVVILIYDYLIPAKIRNFPRIFKALWIFWNFIFQFWTSNKPKMKISRNPKQHWKFSKTSIVFSMKWKKKQKTKWGIQNLLFCIYLQFGQYSWLCFFSKLSAQLWKKYTP